MTNFKNSNPQPESSPQWDKLLFANDISEKTEKVWFEKIFGFWKEIKQFEKWTTTPTLKEIQTLFEKENREFPEITLKVMKETWKKLYDETAFKTKRTMLGYSKKQSQLDPKIVNSFYYTLQNEIDEKIEKKFNDWVETVSKESIWEKHIDQNWNSSFKEHQEQFLGELLLKTSEEQKDDCIQLGKTYVYEFFYEHFLTETIIEENYNHYGGYYDNQRYTYVNTGEEFTFKNTPKVSDFMDSSTGDYYHPRTLGDMMEMEFYKGCKEYLIHHALKHKVVFGLESLNDENAVELVGDTLDEFCFYDTADEWYWEEYSTWNETTSEDMLFEAENFLETVSKEAKDRFRQLIVETAEDEQWKKELFENEFNYLFSSKVMNKNFIIHVGPTNSGKTYSALQKLKEANSGCYLGPLRLLAYEARDTLIESGVNCSLLTGEDNQSSPNDTHVSSTVEMFSSETPYDVLVIDECQMISDKDRGFSWIKAMLNNRASEVHLICSEYALNLLLELLKGQETEVIRYTRQTPLTVLDEEVDIYELEKQVQKDDACIVFSKKKVLATAAYLEENGIKTSIIYGAMPPEVRIKQVEEFINKKTDVIVSTDAIGMGLNLPIKRVLFLETEKFDGECVRPLNNQEIKQIAGRAGRKGLYENGYVLFPDDIKQYKKKLNNHDTPLDHVFIQPTRALWKKFEEKSGNPERFFRLWNEFEIHDERIEKKLLSVELERLQIIRECKGYYDFLASEGMYQLYRLLSLPFRSDNEKLNEYYVKWCEEVFLKKKLSEPSVDVYSKDLDELEADYSTIGLYLLMKHFCKEKNTSVWEEVRHELSSKIDELIKKQKRNNHKTCKYCDKKMEWHSQYNICQNCYRPNKRNYQLDDEDDWEDDEF